MSTLNFGKANLCRTSPPWTVHVGEAEYHRQALSGKVVTSSLLKEFKTCPAFYHALVTGREATGNKIPFRMGKAVHKLLLEGEAAWRSAYVVGGPMNERTGKSFAHGSRTFRMWVEENGLVADAVLTPAEAAEMIRMRHAVAAHREASRLLRDGWPEICAEADIDEVACRCRMDWLRADGDIVELKTTSDIGRFEGDARRFGYLHQFAFYRQVAAAAGAYEPGVAVVVVEKSAPYRVGVWTFSPEVLAPYAAQNALALKTLRRCRENNRWPTGYEGARRFPPAAIPPLWLN